MIEKINVLKAMCVELKRYDITIKLRVIENAKSNIKYFM